KIDFPATEIRVGIILITVPNTIKSGPNKEESSDTIHAVEVVPTLVPNKTIILSRKVITPEFTKDTVNEDTKVLDCTIEVKMPPNRKPPNGKTVTFFIHFAKRS